MKTILFNTETKIISGFGEAQIDPVETYKVVNELLPKTNEYKKIQEKKSQLSSIAMSENNSRNDAKRVFFLASKRLGMLDFDMSTLMIANPEEAVKKLNADEKQKLDTADNLVKKRIEETKATMSELKVLLPNLNNKEKELVQANAVYFGTKPGEDIIDDAMHNKYIDEIKKLGEGEKLTIDFGVIAKPVAEEPTPVEEVTSA